MHYSQVFFGKCVFVRYVVFHVVCSQPIDDREEAGAIVLINSFSCILVHFLEFPLIFCEAFFGII